MTNKANPEDNAAVLNWKGRCDEFYELLEKFPHDDDNLPLPDVTATMYLQRLKSKANEIENLQKQLLENERLEQRMVETEELLKNERASQEEENFWEKNNELFSQLCRAELMAKAEEGDDVSESLREEGGKKDFLKRNIELSAKAMSKLSLTDEEKQRLEKILEQEDSEEAEGESETTHEEVLNAFRLCEDAESRICEIDMQLESGPQDLKTANSNLAESFWKGLLLEQMLADVDKKLDALKEEEQVEEGQN